MRIVIILILCVLSATFGYSAEISSDFTPDQNQLIVQVSGVVCSFCAYGLIKKTEALDYIDASQFKNGIHVDIDKQKITLAIDPQKKIDLKKLDEEIRRGGYEPIAVYLNLSGVVNEVDNKMILKHIITNQLFELGDFSGEKPIEGSHHNIIAMYC